MSELPQRVPQDVFTARLPAVPVRAAVAREPGEAQHALGVGPAPLFDPDRVAGVDPPADNAAAAVELCGDELADELDARSGSAWFAPALPPAVLGHGTPVPRPRELVAAASALDVLHDAVRRWLNAWAGVEMGRAPE